MRQSSSPGAASMPEAPEPEVSREQDIAKAQAGHQTRWTPPKAVIANHRNVPEMQQQDGIDGQDNIAAERVEGQELQPSFKSLAQQSKPRSGRGKKRSAEGDGSATKAPANDKAAANDTSAAAKDPQAKGKRKYVKSGKFVGKFNSYQKQREGKSNDEGRAGSKRSRKKTAEEAADGTTAPTASSPHFARAMESPFASESSQETPPEAKRGRPKGVTRKKKVSTVPEAHTDGNTPKAAAPAVAAPNAKGRRRNGPTHAQTDATPEPEVAANMESEEDAADGADKSEADVEAGLDMARKASTGDGSRLERPAAASDDSNLNSVVQSGHQAQTDSQVESRQTLAGQGAMVFHGTRVFNPISTASKAPHRLSKVTGREMLGSGDHREGDPSGLNSEPPHRDDSTFGEYMAALEHKSSSGNGVRRLSSSGNSGRLMEMLHGSDGWEKLASQLQHKEEADAQQAAVQDEQQSPPGRCKRGRPPKNSSDPPAQGNRQHRGVAGASAASATSTEDSQGSRPKRALQRFDYNVLNGTSASLNAMLQAADLRQQSEQSKPRVHKKRQVKLDRDGNRPEVSVYARAYNRVKAQFARIKMEDTLLGVYGADAWGGASQERVKLQFELDRARDQVLKCKATIRECVKLCEEAEGDKAIPSQHYDSDGELAEEFIFCAKCLKGESQEDNDIVLCDGACNRGYHEQCLQPRIHAQELPEDEGWLCPACDAKAEIILAINEEYGFDYDQEAPWQILFAEDPSQAKEVTGSGNGQVSFLNMDLGDSDSDDSSFGSDDLSDHKGDAAGKEEGDQEADSRAGSAKSEHGSDSSSSSGSASSSDSGLADLENEHEALHNVEVDITAPRAKRRRAAAASTHDHNVLPEQSGTPGPSASDDVSEIVTGKRKRKTVDYKALNDSMFGNTECYEGEGLEEDQEYAPSSKRHQHDSGSE